MNDQQRLLDQAVELINLLKQDLDFITYVYCPDSVKVDEALDAEVTDFLSEVKNGY